jgi:hypothetical protein
MTIICGLYGKSTIASLEESRIFPDHSEKMLSTESNLNSFRIDYMHAPRVTHHCNNSLDREGNFGFDHRKSGGISDWTMVEN